MTRALWSGAGLAAVAAVLALGTACEVSPGLDECVDDPAVEAENKVLAEDFGASTHELIACGQLVTRIARAILETAVLWVGDEAVPPDAYTYTDGVYRTVGEGMVMDLELVRGKDTPGGATGTPLGADVFALDSWLVGATIADDGDDVLVSFDSPGPLVALLGKGPNPDNPLRLTPDDLETIALNLASIEIVGDIWSDDVRGKSTLTWHVHQLGGAVGDVATTGAVDVSRVKDAAGTRESQTLKTTVWDVVYVDPSALNGTVEAEVTGGDFDYRVTWEYVASGTAEPIYACL